MAGEGDPTPSIRRAPDALWRRCPRGTLVLIDGTVHTLGGPGVAIWDLLESPCEPNDLTARVAVHHGVDAREIAGDVAAAVDALARVGVLEPVPADAS